MSINNFNNILNGIDIVNNKRIKKIIDKSSENLKDIFSEKEIEYCFSKKNPTQSLAVRFAAKEAVIKAVDSYILEYDLNKIEVINTESGKPELLIHCNKLKDKIKKLLNKNKYSINLTLSHEKEFSVAHVLIY